MLARALELTGDLRWLAAGLAALVIGLSTFVILSVLAVITPAVSGAWLVLPCVVMLAAVAAVTVWLVFGQGAQRFDPAPVASQPWPWGTSEQ